MIIAPHSAVICTLPNTPGPPYVDPQTVGMMIPRNTKAPPRWQSEVQETVQNGWLTDLGSNQGPAD